MAADESILGGGRFATDAAGYAATLARVRPWPERVQAVEGCQGIGRHLASRLLADGEQVIDVPAGLSARMRVFAAGQGRRTDATGAHSVALAAARRAGLRPVAGDQQRAVPRILAPAACPGRGPHADGLPAAPSAAGTHPRRAKKDLRRPRPRYWWPRSAPAMPQARPAAGSPPG